VNEPVIALEALASFGDAPALITRDATLSYADLASRAARARGALVACGVAEGDAVGLVSSGRGVDEAIGLAALLSLGAVVIPLDATAPAKRHASILAARNARALVHDVAGEALAKAAISSSERALGRVALDANGEVASQEASRTERASGDTSLACILHTSGSTGTPKPVPITREGLIAFTSWMTDLLSLRQTDRVLRVAELVFDLAWFDHAATLRAGAALVLLSRRDLAAGRAFADGLAALEPTIIYGVPSLFMKVTSALREGEMVTARAMPFAGEVFPPRELQRFAERAPNARLFNLYGPTETNVCTFHEVDRAALDGERELPIGLPTPYARCHIGDESDEERAVLDGATTGELIVAGPSTIGGGPYATRDRVERRSDGLLYFRGRIDRMIKVRGYRVEPGEVEAALAQHEAVRQAAVITKDDPRLGRVLRGFVALREGTDLAIVTPRALRSFLAERLPPYMVPDAITTMDELPRTVTGKIDYAALG
jgi:acyl-coenzyme A synthetase/AMP-(fatty) acid ligase